MIKMGQEITISYMGPKNGIREDMREDLLNTWYFQCVCEGFSLTAVERKKTIMAHATQEQETYTKSPSSAEPVVEQNTGVASTSNNTTNVLHGV